MGYRGNAVRAVVAHGKSYLSRILVLVATCATLLFPAVASATCSFTANENQVGDVVVWSPTGTQPANLAGCDPFNSGIYSDVNQFSNPITTSQGGSLTPSDPGVQDQFTYTPKVGFYGTDTATYYAWDTNSNYVPYTVTITVSAVVPTVSSVSPSSGPAAGGISVSISGAAFTGATAVRFGGTGAASFIVNSDSSITATAPAGTSNTTTDITVTTPGGTSVVGSSDQFTYNPPPAVTAVSPGSGVAAGGASVTVTGTHFTGATAVKFGSVNATSFTVSSATSITATAPAGSGTVDITVTTPNGTSAAGGSDQFTYLPAPTVSGIAPSTGVVTGGQSITITGANFAGATAVKFGGASATSFTVNSATSISATSPAGSGTVDITVTTPGGTSANSGSDQFTYVPAPAVGSISPGNGPAAGGTTVNITGTNFAGATTVKFGSTSASSFSVNSANSITATAPAGSGTVDIVVTTAYGTSAASGADQFTYVQPPVAGAVGTTVAHGSTGNAVTLNLSGGAATSVAVATAAAHGTATASGIGITYTPNASYSGTDSFTYTATNGAGTSSPATVTITVSPAAVSYAPASPAAGSVGAAYSQSVASASGGTAPYTYVLAAGTLPPGITLSGAGTLSGVPTSTGSFSFTVAATDSSTGAGPFSATSGTLNLTISAPTISLSPSSLTNPTTGIASSQSVSASGGTAPYSYAITAGALPTGMSLSSGGILSGTPTAGGTFTFKVRATDSSGGTGPFTGTQSYSLNIAAPTIALSPATLPSATVGTAYGQAVTASGGIAPYIYAVTSGSLPAGMTLSSNGALSGTPVAGGSFSFTISATDSSTGTGPFTGSRAYALAVGSPSLTMTPLSATGLTATAGSSYSQAFTAGGGNGPYAYTLTVNSGTMPTGLSFNAASHTLSGTPTTAGAVNFTVTATDSSSGTGPYAVSSTYTLTVGAPSVTVAPATLGNPAIDTAYSQALTASNGTAPYTFAITSGALPAGLSLSSAGVLSGTPTAGGSFTFTVTATDAHGFAASRAYGVTIAGASIALTPATVPGAAFAVSYSQTFAASGGTGPYTYAVASGALPPGMSLNGTTGVLSGMPTALGTSTFTIRATDSSKGSGAPYSGTRVYAIAVGQSVGTAPPIAVTITSAAPVTLHATVNATGGPFSSVTIVTAPASGTAAVNGTDIVYTPAPTTSGNISFAYALVNTAGASAPILVTVTVNTVPVAVAQKQASTSEGQAVNIDLTDGATGGPFTGAAIVSIVPPNAGTATIVQQGARTGASVKAAVAAAPVYLLSFIPAGTFSGTAVVSYTLSNAVSTSAPAVIQVSVVPRKDPSTDPDVSGLIYAQIQAAQRFATTQIGNYDQRLEALHGTGRAPSGNGIAVALPSPGGDPRTRCQNVFDTAARTACLRGDSTIGAPTPARGKRNEDANNDKSHVDAGPGSDRPDAQANPSDLAFWSAGTLDFGFANTGAQRSGFRFTTGGITAGADYRVSDQVSVGAGFGYGHDSTDIGSDGTKSTGDAYSVALYGSYRPMPALFLDGVAGFGTLGFDSRRWVTDDNEFAVGKRNGHQVFASVSAGYEHRDSDWLISPYGRLSVSESTLNRFSETGAGIDALTYFAQTVTTVSGTLGLRTEFARKTKWGMVLPYARIEYQHEFNGRSNAGLAYADLASLGPAYTVSGSPYSQDSVQMGLGAKFVAGTLTLGLDYSVAFGMGGLQQGVRVTFEMPF